MKSGYLLTAAAVMGMSVSSVCFARREGHSGPKRPPTSNQPNGGQAAQPTQKPQPPAQPPKQPQSSNNQNNNSTNGNSSTNNGSSNNNNSNNPKQQQDRRRNYPPGYYNPYGYGYGQPMSGVYYPGGGSVTSSNGTNPNAVNPNNNANPNPFQQGNNAPAGPNNFNGNVGGGNTPSGADSPKADPPDPDVVQASADLKAAMDEFRQNLLKTNADYQAAVAEKQAAQEESAKLHADENTPTEQIMASAQRVLEASTKVAKIEREAAAKDTKVQDAQSKLQTALANHAATMAATK